MSQRTGLPVADQDGSQLFAGGRLRISFRRGEVDDVLTRIVAALAPQETAGVVAGGIGMRVSDDRVATAPRMWGRPNSSSGTEGVVDAFCPGWRGWDVRAEKADDVSCSQGPAIISGTAAVRKSSRVLPPR